MDVRFFSKNNQIPAIFSRLFFSNFEIFLRADTHRASSVTHILSFIRFFIDYYYYWRGKGEETIKAFEGRE